MSARAPGRAIGPARFPVPGERPGAVWIQPSGRDREDYEQADRYGIHWSGWSSLFVLALMVIYFEVSGHYTGRLPFWLAYAGGFVSEVIGRAVFLKRPPHITRYAVGLIGRPTLYSTAKARTELGWQLSIDVKEGLRRTLDWYRQHETISPKK